MQGVLSRYLGTPESIYKPSGFSQMLEDAGMDLRGKVMSVMTKDDWSRQEAACLAALQDEAARTGRLLYPDEQERRIRSETAGFVVTTALLKILEQVRIPLVRLIELQPEDSLQFGGGYKIGRASCRERVCLAV